MKGRDIQLTMAVKTAPIPLKIAMKTLAIAYHVSTDLDGSAMKIIPERKTTKRQRLLR